jgi:hypothetical protein
MRPPAHPSLLLFRPIFSFSISLTFPLTDRHLNHASAMALNLDDPSALALKAVAFDEPDGGPDLELRRLALILIAYQ